MKYKIIIIKSNSKNEDDIDIKHEVDENELLDIINNLFLKNKKIKSIEIFKINENK